MANKKGDKVKIGNLWVTRGVRTVLIVVGLLIVIRLLLPFVILHYANNTLARVAGYHGHVEDIDLAIIRGAYQLKNIYINKVDTPAGNQVPFFRSDLVD